MIVKCGREEINLTEKDVIMYNGAVYQILTRKLGSGWNTYTPKIAKAKAQKMIKDGLLVLDRKEKSKMLVDTELEYYKIKE